LTEKIKENKDSFFQLETDKNENTNSCVV